MLSDKPVVVLIGRYPVLRSFLRQLIIHALPDVIVREYSALSGTSSSQDIDLLVYIKDRDFSIEMDRLAALTAGSPYTHSILVLTEQPIMLKNHLPRGVVVQDMAIDASKLEATLMQMVRCNHAITPHSDRAIPPLLLTTKERHVLRHLSSGISNKAIAYKMQLSESTVKYHMGKLLAKTGCDNRTRMALLADQILLNT